MPIRDLLPATATGLAAMAAATPTRSDSRAPARPLLLEDFFVGRLTAKGRFRSRIARVDRGFTVKAHGRIEDDVLVLVEDFFFDDGETDRKTWRFQKVGPGRYEATREDMVGVADVQERDGRIHMTYVIDLGAEGNKTRVRFRDVLYYGADGKVINTARVSKFGIPIAGIHVLFEK